MTVYILFIFIVGYVFISTEHWHRIDKMIPAILMMVLSWGLIFVFPNSIPQWLDPSSAELLLSKLGFVPDLVGNTAEKTELINTALQHHLSKTAEIVVFLIGAMTLKTKSQIIFMLIHRADVSKLSIPKSVTLGKPNVF